MSLLEHGKDILTHFVVGNREQQQRNKKSWSFENENLIGISNINKREREKDKSVHHILNESISNDLSLCSIT